MSTKISFDTKSIRFRLWIFFLLLAIIMLSITWVLQTYFLQNQYEQYKIQEVEKNAQEIFEAWQANDGDFTNYVQGLSISNDLYVMMENNEQLLLFVPDQDSVAPVYKYKNEIPKLREALEDSDEIGSSYSFSFYSMGEKYRTLAYEMVVGISDEGNPVLIYIFTPLYPVTSTVQILNQQFVRVAIITLIVAFFLSAYFSRRMSRPLKEITNTAKQMGTGDYNVKFEGNSYTEINNLARTLNLTAYELGMLDQKQKDICANVSHDLKTPLTMVKSYAEMIRDLSGDNPVKRNEHLKVIISEADRMASLVSDMASVSSMQTKKMVLDKQYFDLAKDTAQIIASYKILEEQEGYTFGFTAPDECYVYADENRIKQVIENLTGNAVKYCGEDKIILVSVRKLGKKYRFEVQDHGPGIKEEEIPHVWDRYYRTSTNYARATTGTGLGLSIVKEILTLHNAQYGVNSKLNKGSTFWFELDAAKKDEIKALNKASEKPETEDAEDPQEALLEKEDNQSFAESTYKDIEI